MFWWNYVSQITFYYASLRLRKSMWDCLNYMGSGLSLRELNVWPSLLQSPSMICVASREFSTRSDDEDQTTLIIVTVCVWHLRFSTVLWCCLVLLFFFSALIRRNAFFIFIREPRGARRARRIQRFIIGLLQQLLLLLCLCFSNNSFSSFIA